MTQPVSRGITLREWLARTQSEGRAPQWSGHCPIHQDDRKSLSTTLKDGRVLVACHGPCGHGKQFTDQLADLGLWPVSPDTAELKLATSNKNPRQTVTVVLNPSTQPPPTPTPDGFIKAMVHEYRTMDGTLSGTVTRFEQQAEAGEKAVKSFRPMFNFLEENETKWLMRMPSPRPLYGLHSLTDKATFAQPVLLVEGEKTADAARLRFPNYAVVSPMGGLNGLMHSDLEPLQGRSILVWPDHDENWYEQTLTTWVPALKLAKVRAIGIVQLDKSPVKLPMKWDLADSIENYQQTTEAILRSARDIAVEGARHIEAIKSKEDLIKNFVVVQEGSGRFLFHFVEDSHEFGVEQFDKLYHPHTRAIGMTPSNYFMDRREYLPEKFLQGYTYDPGRAQRVQNPRNPGTWLWNLWRRAPILPLECDYSDLRPLWDHLDYLLGDDDQRILVERMASMVQQPMRRPKWIYMLQGSTEGTGKSSLLSLFRPVVGWQNYAEVDASTVFGNFNSFIHGKLMIVFSEFVDTSKNQDSQAKLKRLIADPTINYTRKYHDEIEIPNRTHLFGTTNLETPIILSESDRRYHVARVIADKKESIKYYQTWWRFHDDPATARMLLYYLQNYDLSDYDVEAVGPEENEAKAAIIENSRSTEQIRLEDLLLSEDGYFSKSVFIFDEFMERLEERKALHKSNRNATYELLHRKFGAEKVSGKIKRKYTSNTIMKPCKLLIIPRGKWRGDELRSKQPDDWWLEFCQERGLQPARPYNS